ncbi:MAG: hypothetical protein ABIQ01_03320 [Pseudolysinimonas sp.]
MRRLTPAIAAVVVVMALSGCGPSSEELGGVLEGSCLRSANGEHADPVSKVDCEEPHLFEVTSMGGWPGLGVAMADAGGDAGDVWDAIHGLDDSDDSTVAADFATWASRACAEGAQRTTGISEVKVDGHTASDLWLRVGGTYGIDITTATRAAFIAGDQGTYCSLAWYDDSGAARLLAGRPFSQLLGPGFDLDRRECWDVDDRPTSCARPHAAQVLLAFDGLEAFGPELIARAASGVPTDLDRAAGDSFCAELLRQTLPSVAETDEVGFVSEPAAGSAWDEYDGTIDPRGGYFYACLAVGPQGGDLVIGDVMDGTARLQATGGDG